MAITRAQQVKQLLAQGGRIGFQGGGKDMSTVSAADIDIGTSTDKRDYSPQERQQQRETQKLNERIERNRRERERQRVKDEIFMTPIGRNRPLGPISLANAKFQRNMNINLARKRAEDLYKRLEDYVVGDTDMDYDFSDAPEGLATLTSNKGTSIESTRPNLYTVNPDINFPSTLSLIQSKIRPDTQVTLRNTLNKARDYTNLINESSTMTNQEIKDALTELQNRGKTPDQINPTGGGGENVFDPCKGPNPPAYCFVGIRSVEPEIKEEVDMDDRALAFRAEGGRIGLENGGISLQEAKDMAPKGEFLAYINAKEAKMLKDAGGSGIMTNAGIPSFVEYGGQSGFESAKSTGSVQGDVDRGRGDRPTKKPIGGGGKTPDTPIQADPRFDFGRNIGKGLPPKELARLFNEFYGLPNPDEEEEQEQTITAGAEEGINISDFRTDPLASSIRNQPAFQSRIQETVSGIMANPDLANLGTIIQGKAEGGRIGLMEGGMPYEGGIMDQSRRSQNHH